MLQYYICEPEQAKGADGMQLCVMDSAAYIVDAERNECLLAEMMTDANESWKSL